MTLLLLFGQPAAAPPQTWTATAGTITMTGASGTFTAGGSTWSANAATVTIAGSSSNVTGAVTWTGNTGTISHTGSSGTFAAGGVTWSASAATILVQAVSGDFGPVTPVGSTGSPHFANYHPITFDYQPPADDQLALIMALI